MEMVKEKSYKLKIEHTSPVDEDPYHTFYMIYYLNNPLEYEHKVIYFKISLSSLENNSIHYREINWLSIFIDNIENNKNTINYDFKSLDEYLMYKDNILAKILRNNIIKEKNNIINNKYGSVITYSDYNWCHRLGEFEFIIRLNKESKEQFIDELYILMKLINTIILPYKKKALYKYILLLQNLLEERRRMNDRIDIEKNKIIDMMLSPQ